MPILSTGVRDKVATSSLVAALHPLSVNSALVLLEAVSKPDKVVVHAPLIVDLTTASGSTLAETMTVTMKMLTHMPDFLLFKVLVDLLVLSVSLVPLTPRALDLKPLSASSTLAVDLAPALNLPLTSMVRLLSAVRRVMLAFLVMLVALTAPIPLSTAVPSERRSVLVVVWAEVLAITVFALATRASRVRTVLSELN
jgi:hypothetical protein